MWEIRQVWWMRHIFDSICSIFEALVVWCEVRHCHEEEFGYFFCPIMATSVEVFRTSHPLAEHTSQMWWFFQDSESCSGSNEVQTATQWPWQFFAVSLTLRSDLELLLSPTIDKIQFSLHVTIQLRNGLLLFHRIREDDISKWLFFFQSAHEILMYWAFLLFQFSSNVKWP